MIAPAVLAYLIRYGWLDEVLRLDRDAVLAALARFKAFIGLDEDPHAVTESLETLVAQPRCGVSDVQEARDSAAKWNTRDLRMFCGVGGIGGFSAGEVTDICRKACQSWQDVCGLRFEMVDTQREANIFALPKPLPGPTLAWSYLPDARRNPPEQIEQRYDTTVNWRQQGAEYLQGVFAHELGHALGLSHSRRGNLMQPMAEAGLYLPQSGDVAEVVERYGQPRPKPEPPATPGTPSGEIVVATGVRIPAGRFTIVLRPE